MPPAKHVILNKSQVERVAVSMRRLAETEVQRFPMSGTPAKAYDL